MPSGEQRVFQPDSRGSDYFDQPGDYGILTEGTGGTFTLQETDGQIEAFNAERHARLHPGHQRQPDHGRLHGRPAHQPDRHARAHP